MTEISFIYKTNCDDITRYGKIKLNHISNNHKGLDIEIRRDVWYCLAYGLIQEDKDLYTLDLGIIGVVSNNNYKNYFTSNEFINFDMKMFSVYIFEEKNITYSFYNGKEITNQIKEFYVDKINIYRWEYDDDDFYISSSDDEEICDVNLTMCEERRLNVTPIPLVVEDKTIVLDQKNQLLRFDSSWFD